MLRNGNDITDARAELISSNFCNKKVIPENNLIVRIIGRIAKTQEY
jgi:hypothetical protein